MQRAHERKQPLGQLLAAVEQRTVHVRGDQSDVHALPPEISSSSSSRSSSMNMMRNTAVSGTSVSSSAFSPTGIRHQRADRAAENENKDDRIVILHFSRGAAVSRLPPDDKLLGSRTQIARAHGGREGAAAHLAEGLDLHGADERDDDVDHGIRGLRQQGGDRHEHHFAQNDDLTPVNVDVAVLTRLEAALDELGGQHAERKRHDRQQIAQRPFPNRPRRDVRRAARYFPFRRSQTRRRGKDRYRHQKAACERKKQPQNERLGHLSLNFFHGLSLRFS